MPEHTGAAITGAAMNEDGRAGLRFRSGLAKYRPAIILFFTAVMALVILASNRGGIGGGVGAFAAAMVTIAGSAIAIIAYKGAHRGRGTTRSDQP